MAPHQKCCATFCLVFQDLHFVRNRSAIIETKRNSDIGGTAAGNETNLRICLVFGRFEDFLYSGVACAFKSELNNGQLLTPHILILDLKL